MLVPLTYVQRTNLMLIGYRPFIMKLHIKLSMKLITNLTMLATLFSLGCTFAVAGDNKPGRSDHSEASDGTSTLTVGLKDDARHILDVVPSESAMELFDIHTADGRNISYVAFTDTDVGGLVFVESKLFGTVSRRDAQSFYSCRGYATTVQAHWAEEAPDWVNALLAATTPASSVTLHFSGKSTPQSIKEVANNQMLSQLSLFDLSTNPFSLLRKLNSARDNMREREKYESTLQALKAITTGTSEAKISEILMPEDVFFGDGGLVLAYPRFALEYYVSAGTVKITQQPSFYRISRVRPALFYAPNVKWEQCTPQSWRSAMPVLKATATP